ncbi:MAG: hypothetical protein U1E65_06115 [Myxococcota bacterium]
MSEPKWNVLDAQHPVLWAFYQYGKSGKATSAVFGLASGGLAILSPPSGFSKADYAELARFGEITAIIAPSGYHHLGIPGCLEAYPNARLYADARTARRILAKNPALAGKTFEPLEALSPQLGTKSMLAVPPGMRIQDVMARFETSRGWIWYSNDLVSNHSKPSSSALVRLIQGWTHTPPGLAINGLLALALVKSGKQCWPWLRDELKAHPPIAFIVGHGKPAEGSDLGALLLGQLERRL